MDDQWWNAWTAAASNGFGQRMVCLAALRIGGLLAVAPLFGRRTATWRVKLMLGLALVLLIGPSQLTRLGPAAEIDALQWLAWSFREAAIGLSLGLAVLFLASGVAMAGEAVGVCIGWRDSGGNSAGQPDVSGRFLELTTFALLVASGAHRWVVDALLESFQSLPCGVHEPVSLTAIVGLASHSFHFAVRAAAPIVGAALAAHLLLAMLARSQPVLRNAALQSTSVGLAGVGAWLLVLGAAGLWASDELQAILQNVQQIWMGNGA